MPQNEGQVLLSIVKAVHTAYPESWIFKVHGDPYQMSGVPDLLICVRGLLVGAEVKFQRPGESADHARGRATPGQRIQIARINSAGGIAAVVLSPAETLALIERGLTRKPLGEGRKDD